MSSSFINNGTFTSKNDNLISFNSFINRGVVSSEKGYVGITGYRVVNDGTISGKYILLPNVKEIEGKGNFNAEVIFVNEAIKEYFKSYDNVVVIPSHESDWNYITCKSYLVTEGYYDATDC